MQGEALIKKQMEELERKHGEIVLALQRQVLMLQEALKTLGAALPAGASEAPDVPPSPLPSALEILKDVKLEGNMGDEVPVTPEPEPAPEPTPDAPVPEEPPQN